MGKITYSNEILGHYSGQTNGEAGIFIDGEIVGVSQYTLYRGELTISNIFIRPEYRKMGYGSRLIKYIKEQNPKYVYRPSWKTGDGAKFVHKDLPLYESLGFKRGDDPKDSLKIGREDIRIFNKLNPIAKDFGFIPGDISDLNPSVASKAWEHKNDPGKRIILFKSKNSGKWKIFIRWGTLNIQDWTEWDSYDKWRENLTYIFGEKLFEFVRGTDPKSSMHIGKRALIDKWFTEYAPDAEYTVDDDWKIVVDGHLFLGRTAITELPEGLSVGGSLYLGGTGITELPQGLSVGGDLDLEGTAITELPEGLSVGGYLDLGRTAITELPQGLSVGGYLDLRETAITELPEDLSVGGSLYLRRTAIRELPKSLKVKGRIYKDF